MDAEHTEESAADSRQERKPSDVRSRIVAAATKLFGEFGYAETSMERIAAEAGVARASVFNHFAQKELLVGAIIEKTQETFFRRLHADPAPDCTPREQIVAAVAEWSMAYAADVTTAVPTMRTWVLAGGAYLAEADEAPLMYEELIRQAQADGRVAHSRSPQGIGRALNDAIVGAMIRWTRDDNPTAESLRSAMLAAVEAIRLE